MLAHQRLGTYFMVMSSGDSAHSNGETFFADARITPHQANNNKIHIGWMGFEWPAGSSTFAARFSPSSTLAGRFPSLLWRKTIERDAHLCGNGGTSSIRWCFSCLRLCCLQFWRQTGVWEVQCRCLLRQRQFVNVLCFKVICLFSSTGVYLSCQLDLIIINYLVLLQLTW